MTMTMSEENRLRLLKLYRETIGYPRVPEPSPQQQEDAFGDFLGFWLSGRSRVGRGARSPIVRYRIKQRWER